MIFLKSQNLLFLRPRKVASTSFEIALSKFAQPQDIITPFLTNDEEIRRKLGFPGPQNYLHPLATRVLRQIVRKSGERHGRKRFYNHMSAKDVRRKLGEATFDNAFKVSIIRNPYDALVSMYYWQNKRPKARPPFREWAMMNPSALSTNTKLYLIDGQDVVDFYIRFEALDEDIRALEAVQPGVQGLADTFASITTKSKHRPARATASAMFEGEPDLAAAVRFYNEFAIRRFNYRLE